MAEPKKIAILGSTGTIGVKAVHLAASRPDRFRVITLAAGHNADLVAEQAQRLKPELISVRNGEVAARVLELLGETAPEVVHGPQGLVRAADDERVELVLSAVSGFAGLAPTLAAATAGKTIALSNKESLVAGGDLVMAAARQSGAMILPVDSEHSAIYQSLTGHRRSEIRRIILTASGGPFRKLDAPGLARVTPEQALDHPNWAMGDKVTIDSATLMNKGLELIEAMHLFALPPERIEVVVHPQSIVHSAVEYIDGSVVAQLAVPDMTLPIAYAMAWPTRLPLDWIEPLDLIKAGRLDFEAPDLDRFPCLGLAMEAARAAGGDNPLAPAVLNAADEAAVAAFLDKRIGLPDIPAIIGRVLAEHSPAPADSLETVVAADAWARARADELARTGTDKLAAETDGTVAAAEVNR